MDKGGFICGQLSVSTLGGGIQIVFTWCFFAKINPDGEG